MPPAMTRDYRTPVAGKFHTLNVLAFFNHQEQGKGVLSRDWNANRYSPDERIYIHITMVIETSLGMESGSYIVISSLFVMFKNSATARDCLYFPLIPVELGILNNERRWGYIYKQRRRT